MGLLKKTTFFILVLLALMSCALVTDRNNEPLHKSSQYYDYLQPTFDDYLSVTRQWLKHNRRYISDDHEKEIVMNSPFELGNKHNTDKAILLIHGLSDSPYSFSDLAKSLQKQGFYVQTLLLPGHGSKPDDLMLPTYSDWQDLVDHYADLLKQDFENVWLGGFSTGSNLVTIHAMTHDDIAGLMLFSPGFQTKIPVLERFAPLASIFVDGYDREETNLARYSSSSIHGAIAYTESAFRLRDLLDVHKVGIPTLVVISEADSIIDSDAVRELFLARFSHPKNKLVWYGKEKSNHDVIQTLTMQLDTARISSGSHMSTVFAPDNPYYGLMGERRTCKTRFKKPVARSCQNTDELWFAAWGYQEEGKTHTRLTWNPYYSELEHTMYRIASGAAIE